MSARTTALCALLVSSGLTLTTLARANDFTVGGTPSDLVPIDETSIAMKSEDIVMEFSEGEWLVTAEYVFVNASDKPITHQVGFPEINCDPNGEDDCASDAFENLATRVNGQAVTHQRGKISSMHAWKRDLGTVWLFNATFDPKIETHISHSYKVFTGSNLSWIYDIHYLVETGRGWAGGRIGSARFRVKLPPAAHTIFPGDYKNPPRYVNGPGQRPYFLLERENEDWVPPTAIGMSFIFTSWSDIHERLGADRFERSGVKKEDECPSPIAPETAAQKQMCRNLIYAVSGYPFKSEKLRKYFYGNPFDWRRSKDHWSNQDSWIRGLRPFDNFDARWIPALDRSFLSHLDTLEFPEETAPTEAPLALPAEDTEAAARADYTLKLALKDPTKVGAGARVKSRPNTPQIAVATPALPKPPVTPKPEATSTRWGLCSTAPASAGRASSAAWLTLLASASVWLRRRKTSRAAPRWYHYR